MSGPSEKRQGLLLAAPAAAALALVALGPLLATAWLSLRRRIPVFGEDRFVGLANYRALLEDARFWNALYPHMTVRQNLSFPLEVARLARREIAARVGEVTALLGLEALLDRRPAALSGGERQRVALGRALVRRPRLFLFDEPLSNLDAALRVSVRAELKKLHERLGATFVYVTHDQAEAMTLADRIAVLRAGALEQVGTPREIYGAPATAFVARFVGTPQVNLVPPEALGLEAAGLEAALRPEDLSVELGPAADGLAARVWLVEPMGAETWVTVEREGVRLVARCGPAFEAPPGTPVRLAFDPARVHWFEAANGRRVAPPAG